MRKFLKTGAWACAVVLFLLLVPVVALHFSCVQNVLSGRVSRRLSNEFGTRVELEGIRLKIPCRVEIRGLYLEDQKQDTLWYSQAVTVRIDMLKLLSRTVAIESLRLEGVVVNLNRSVPEGRFNFEFLAGAASDDRRREAAVADPPSTEANPWKIAIKSMELAGIEVAYRDEVEGENARLWLGSLSIVFNDMDPDALRFDVASVGLSDAHVRVVRSKESSPREKEPAEPADIMARVGRLDLVSVALNYNDAAAGESAGVYLGELAVRGFSFASGERDIRLNSLLLVDSAVRYVRARDVPVDEKGIDFSDLDLRDLHIAVTDAHLLSREGRMRVDRVAFHERSGFRLERLAAAIALDDSSASVGDFRLKTGFSSVAGAFSARYPALEAVRDDIRNMRLDLILAGSFVGFGDAFYFQPHLRQQLALSAADGITLDASIAGSVDDLAIDKLDLRALDATRFSARGRVRGLPDVDAAHFDVTIAEFGSGHDDIARLVGAERIPAAVTVPSSLVVAGSFAGTADRFESRIETQSDFGRFAATLFLDREDKIGRYRGTLAVDGFDIGRLLGMPDLAGAVFLDAEFEGSGFDADELDACLDATIARAFFRGYEYNNVRIDGRFRDRRFTGFAGMDDDNLAFRFDGDVYLAGEAPMFSFDLDLSHADLFALRLVESEYSLRGAIKADFAAASIGALDGSLHIRDFVLTHGMTEYAVDSLAVTAATRGGISRLDVASDILSASYSGSVAIADLPAVLAGHVDRYIDLRHLDAEDDAEARRFEFFVTLHDPRLLAEVFVPGLRDLSPSTVRGSYSDGDRLLEVRVDVPRLHYGSIEVDSLLVRVTSDKNSIGYGVCASRLALGSFESFAPEIRGFVEGNVLSADIATHDEEMNVVFALGGRLASADDVYTFMLGPDRLVINYEPWKVSEDNHVRFGGGVLFVNNLMIHRADAVVAVQSDEGDEIAPPVGISIKEFDISSVPRMLGNRDLELAGIVNATVRLSEVFGETKAAAYVSLREFVFGGSAVGDIAIKVSRESADRYDLEASLAGHGNHLYAAGYVSTGDGAGEIDLAVEIRNIELASLEGFAMGELTDMSGRVNGALAITGSADDPNMSGTIVFSDASFRAARLNSHLRLADEAITFGRNAIAFRDFTILDEAGNRAVIDGSIYADEFSGHAFALDIRSTDFMLMNTTRRHNDQFYGRILIDSEISVRGDRNRPAIKATLGFRNGTELTVVVAERDPTLAAREGIVEFARMDDEGKPIRMPEDEFGGTRSALQGIDIAANIEVDRRTNVRVVIDETAGDYVRLLGSGTLSAGIDPSGSMSLAGKYEIAEGAYQMTFYGVSRRRFDIRPGSSVVWTGDPFDAEIDISAIYTVRASPLELVGDYVSDAERRQYRRLLPFQVYLNMKGGLMQPEIDFSVDMPPDQRGAFGGIVYSRVQQLNERESERNKQVFALLVLGRFIAENPLDMQEGGGVAAGARTSASKLLTQQLNALSGRYIRGVAISFDVESYEEYTEVGPQGRTELQLQVSRQFLDDRIVVEAGGQFDIEGERKRQAYASDFAGDVTVEYKLTEDGRYRLRGFRVHEYQGLIDGELISTGISLVFTRDFNRFRELLRRKHSEQKAKENDAGAGGKE